MAYCAGFLCKARASYDGSISLTAVVPHFLFPATGVSGTDTATMETPQTRENSIDISASYIIPHGKWQVRLFGGPSYLQIAQSMWNHFSLSNSTLLAM